MHYGFLVPLEAIEKSSYLEKKSERNGQDRNLYQELLFSPP